MHGHPEQPAFVSRGGLKLQHALQEFGLDVRGLTCADFGCSTGGFTDCLLRAGAAMVAAIDTAYGELAWTLRNDPRVLVMERTNCLHARPPAALVARGGHVGRADLVVIDASWTPQRLVIPAALGWLAPHGKIVSLLKPHYELNDPTLQQLEPFRGRSLPRGGVLEESLAEAVAQAMARDVLPGLGVRVLGLTRSPILGGAGKQSKGQGNAEWLVLVEAASQAAGT